MKGVSRIFKNIQILKWIFNIYIIIIMIQKEQKIEEVKRNIYEVVEDKNILKIIFTNY